MIVVGLSRLERIEKREIRAVPVGQPQPPEVIVGITRQYRQPGVQAVVAFLRQLSIMGRKHLKALRDGMSQGGFVFVIKHYRNRELPEIAAVGFDLFQARAEVSHERHGAVVYEHVLRSCGRGCAHIGHGRGLCVVEMPPLRLDKTAHAQGVRAFPFETDDGVARDLHEAAQHMGERAPRRFLQRQDLHIVVIETKEVTMTFQRGVAGLEIESNPAYLRFALIRLERGIVEQPAKKTKSRLRIERFNIDEIAQMDCEIGRLMDEDVAGVGKLPLKVVQCGLGGQHLPQRPSRLREQQA